jgi:hypothetical protein
LKVIQNTESNRKVLEKLVGLTEVNTRCLLKIDFGLTANAFIHGWKRKDEVESEEDANLERPTSMIRS